MEIVSELKNILGEASVKVDEPLNKYSTFKVGGPAEILVDAKSTEDIIEVVKFANKKNIPVSIFGGLSNVIISDKGIKGIVIKNNARKFEIVSRKGKVKNQKLNIEKAYVYSESGVIMNQLVRFTIEEGLGGLEYHLGLPGTVGGALYMNSNFPKKQSYVGDFLHKATLLTKDGEIKEVENEYFNFAYDKSILQQTGEILLSAVFELTPMEKKSLWERGMEALNYRTETQPKGSSAGCTFRNISIADAITASTPEKITSAGFLIDKAGLKGKKYGGAMISDLHANFILNTGGATSDDVINLVELMKKEVLKKFGVHLALEVKTVGF